MSVFYDNRRPDSGYENRAPSRDSHADWGVFGAGRQPPRRRPEGAEAPLSGVFRQRAEDFIQIVLAFALVGGATALLYSSLFAASPTPVPPAAVAPQLQAASVAPETAPPAPSAADSVPASFFDARLIAGRTGEEAEEEAPRPLAPPSAETRERLAAHAAATQAADIQDTVIQNTAVQDATPEASESVMTQAMATEAEPEPTSAASPVRDETTAAGGGRPAKCFVKLSGRVQANGACRIRRSDEEVAFQFADKTLTFAHDRGRAWTATMGGRALGKVYQVRRGRCWGSRGSGFYACDNS